MIISAQITSDIRSPIWNSRFWYRIALTAFFVWAAAGAAVAQEPTPQLAPPPLKILSAAERTGLDASADMKARYKLLLDLMAARVTAAEKLSSQSDYSGMFTELGGFHGLMDDGIQYLKTKDKDDKKVLDTFKRLEIGLRRFAPRLEAIRRELPMAYEDYVRRVIKYLRSARTFALEPQFGDTVLPGSTKEL